MPDTPRAMEAEHKDLSLDEAIQHLQKIRDTKGNIARFARVAHERVGGKPTDWMLQLLADEGGGGGGGAS